MDNNVAIKVENVSKIFKLPHEKQSSIKSSLINLLRGGDRSYEKLYALKDISFEIKKGDFFGIVGRNGSGKSTLLKLLAGIYIPTQGGIQVNGKLTPFIELGVGFNPELTGRENIFLNGALLGFNRKEIRNMYEEIVSFAELEKFMDQKLKNYSSGMQVRLAFSIAIRAKSEILLLDEVLAVGDSAFQQKCYNYFEELKNQNRTVIFVSHDMGAVMRFCTKAIYINNGLITNKGTPREIVDVYREENIQSTHQANIATSQKDEAENINIHKISAKLYGQTDRSVTYKVSYNSKDKDEMYVGISVIKEGLSVAEITTSLQKPLTSKGNVTYYINTDLFNSGTYEVAAALFKLKNRELLALTKNTDSFVIKGGDLTRGAALKLADTWEYQEES